MDRSRTNSAVLVVLERSGRVPLHRQIATSIRDWTRRAAVAWVVAAALPCPRCRSWRLARRRGRGLPAAGSRGLSGEPGRRVHRWRLVRPHGRQSCAWPAPGRPESTSATTALTCPAFPGSRGCGRSAVRSRPRRMTSSATPWVTTKRAVSAGLCVSGGQHGGEPARPAGAPKPGKPCPGRPPGSRNRRP